MPPRQTWIKKLEDLGALWIHDGNPKRPYALLTSGHHSNGFFNMTKMMERPKLLEEAVRELLQNNPLSEKPDVVVGSAIGAITIAHEIARQLGAKMAFTEKTQDKTAMVFNRFMIQPGEKALIIEDVMTTGGTTLKTLKTLKELGADVLPFLFLLVNRTGEKKLAGLVVKALIDKPMLIWEAGKCPFTKDGQERAPAVRPKENWDDLIREYS